MYPARILNRNVTNEGGNDIKNTQEADFSASCMSGKNMKTYSFTPPSVIPAIMYLERNRYTIMIGTMATKIIM